jgi:rhamnose transport system substrate-binding protein
MWQKRWLGFGVIVSVLALMLVGCKEEPKTNTPTGGSAPTTTQSPGQKFKIVYIPKNTGNPYFEAVIKGFEKSSNELGFAFTSVAPATAEATSQLPFIKQQVQQGVDAIVISANSPDALKQALLEARQKGIRVLTVDADLNGNEEAREAAVMPEFSAIGKTLVELMHELTGGAGEFAILSATTDAPNQKIFIAGMKETLANPKYKDMKLVEIAYGNDDPQKSLTEAQGLLTKYPNLKGIVAPTTVAIAAAAQAVESANAASRIQITGLGTPNQMRRFIENGTLKKFALWSPEDMGYLCGYIADGLLKGTLKAEPGVTFKAGSLGERTFGEKNVVVVGSPVIFEKSNISKYNF